MQSMAMRGAKRLIGIALVATAPIGAQNVPSITLDRGAKEVTEPFTQITGLVHLRDGRLLVHDGGEKSMWVIDVMRDSRTPAARMGSGPTEFRGGTLLEGSSDSVLFYDLEQRRFLVFSQAGTPVRTHSFGGADGSPLSLFSVMQPRSVDMRGNVFGQSSGIVMPSMAELEKAVMAGQVPAPTFADSVTVERLDWHTGRIDTLTKIRSPVQQSAPKTQMVGQTMKMTLRAADFSPHDAWVALADGRVAVLRDGKYQLEIHTVGRPVTRGPSIPFTPIPVTAEEKQAALDSTRSMLKKMREQMSARSGFAADMPGFDVEVLPPLSWATTKPPYQSVMAGPGGRLWIATPSTYKDQAQHFDVVSLTTGLVGRVTLAPGEWIAGFGPERVYTVRRDADDLLHLKMHLLPAAFSVGR